MKFFLLVALICLILGEILADDKLQCYQCEQVTSECTVDKAVAIKCGLMTNSRCSKQVKKGSDDESKAIRKCVVPDTNGQVRCPDGFDCYICDSDLCNNGNVAKLTWISLIGVFVAALYI